MKATLNKVFKILVSLSFVGTIIDYFPMMSITPFVASTLIFIILATITNTRLVQKKIPNFRKELLDSVYILSGFFVAFNHINLTWW